MVIKIPISVGELIDKITILEIKMKLITDSTKLAIIDKELRLLLKEYDKIGRDFPTLIKKVNSAKKDLYNINTKLWNVENNLRSMESHREFESEFIEAARKVYILNDKRARVKHEINKLLGSTIKEVKSYVKY